MRTLTLLQPSRRIFRALALTVVPVLIVASLGAGKANAGHVANIDLGTVDSFSVLAGQTVTNTGPTVIEGDLGLHPGSSVTGFPPGTVNGDTHIANNVALQAKNDLTAAYNDAAGRAVDATIPTELGGTTRMHGVYDSAAGTFGITAGAGAGPLTLDGPGVYIFKMASTLTVGPGATVNLINGADACDVFWQVGSSATLDTTSHLEGNIMALTSISALTGATVDGRTLARNGSVTLQSNDISECVVAAAPPGTIVAAKTHQYEGRAAVRTTGAWVFTLRNSAGTRFRCTNPDPSNPNRCTTNKYGNDFKIRYTALPAGTYTLCEKAFRSWQTQFSNRPPGSNVNGRCITFALAAGASFAGPDQIKVNNFCPKS